MCIREGRTPFTCTSFRSSSKGLLYSDLLGLLGESGIRSSHTGNVQLSLGLVPWHTKKEEALLHRWMCLARWSMLAGGSCDQ